MVAMRGWPALAVGPALLFCACSVMVKFEDPPDMCGDNARQEWEECEGPDLGGLGCHDVGFDRGTLSCRPDCTYDTSECIPATCGNGGMDFSDDFTFSHVLTAANHAAITGIHIHQ